MKFDAASSITPNLCSEEPRYVSGQRKWPPLPPHPQPRRVSAPPSAGACSSASRRPRYLSRSGGARRHRLRVGLTLIAAVYVGFAVADGRWCIIAAESSVAASFVVLAAVAVTGSAWLLVAGLAAHGLKDLWQHRTQYVTGTRWWPPFCGAGLDRCRVQ